MKTNFLVGIVGVLAFFAACGKDRIGGDSETNWMKRCDSNADCGPGIECLCGICSLGCDLPSDCSVLDGATECSAAGTVEQCGDRPPPGGVCVAACSTPGDCPAGYECSSGACAPLAPTGAGGSGGAGETIGGMPNAARGGAPPTGGACVDLPPGFGGALSVGSREPPIGTPCPPQLDGFELCTPRYSPPDFVNNALSRCTDGIWYTVEDPSACEPPDYASCEEPGTCPQYQLECNHPEAANGVCCDAARYCETIAEAVCDGTRWWKIERLSGGSCGDAIRQSAEECDDGNDDERDDCLPNCRLPKCGDAVVHDRGTGREACDDGAANGPYPAQCTNECKLGLCGNGVVDEGEECDDGVAELDSDGEYLRGNHPNAACKPNCAFNSCGDRGAYVFERPDQDNPYGLEECDDGGNGVSDPCTDECAWNRCGDGIRYAVPYDEAYADRTGDGNPIADNPSEGEECEDGNDIDGDGCDAECSKENP